MISKRCAACLSAFLALCFATGLAAAQTTERVTVNSDEIEADERSSGGALCENCAPSISADGRFVAFESYALNLGPGNTAITGANIFIRDRQTGVTEWVSVSDQGIEGNRDSQGPSMSADGRFVAFQSAATNLVPGDTNDLILDIFVRDRLAGKTEKVSVNSNEIGANEFSSMASISADGRFVAFRSHAPNLVTGDSNNAYDIFVRDRLLGTTERVSVSSDEIEADEDSGWLSISGDGQVVVFSSKARNLVPGDASNLADMVDIFARDRVAGTTEKVSVAIGRAQASARSANLSVSADGRFVAFDSGANNLVPGDTNGLMDVFVRDRLAGTTERANISTNGDQADNFSMFVKPSISADGRYVVFELPASNLVAGDTNLHTDVFVRDRLRAVTERVSVNSAGAEVSGSSLWPIISADGRYVAFYSSADDMVPNDTNNVTDAFVRDRGKVDDLLLDFGSRGLYQRLNNNAWLKVHDWPALSIAAGDLDDSGKDEAIASFSNGGLWARYNNTTWCSCFTARRRRVFQRQC